MADILLSGALGQMGRAVAAKAKESPDLRVAAGIDCRGGSAEFPVYPTPEDCPVPVDVIVDFSHPSVMEPLLRYAVTHGVPAVICTTGLDGGQVGKLREASGKIAVFYSANMSIGVNLMAALCEKAAMVLGGQYDIEIVEKHHRRKLDAPSGTALMLADRMAPLLPEKARYVYDRHSQRQARGENEIGFSSVRGGSIVGEHEVIFAGGDEVLTISHSASNKQVFAAGALSAARFLIGLEPGMYDMGDLV